MTDPGYPSKEERDRYWAERKRENDVFLALHDSLIREYNQGTKGGYRLTHPSGEDGGIIYTSDVAAEIMRQHGYTVEEVTDAMPVSTSASEEPWMTAPQWARTEYRPPPPKAPTPQPRNSPDNRRYN
jgi:hypothetical protein